MQNGLIIFFIVLCFKASTSDCPTAMLTSERSPQSSSDTNPAVMPVDQETEMMLWSEVEFEERCTYIVKDQPLEEESENHGKTHAERSLPRNLALKRCHNSTQEVHSTLVFPFVSFSVIQKKKQWKIQAVWKVAVYVFGCNRPLASHFHPLIHSQAGGTWHVVV